jgi:menaquinone-specific isochorismate synthase
VSAPLYSLTLSAEELGTWAREIDPVVFAGRSGCLHASPTLTLAGRGIAARLELDRGLDDRAALRRVRAALGAVSAEGDTDALGRGPVVCGALAFTRAATAHLSIPELVLGTDAAGARWFTLCGGAARPRRADLVAALDAALDAVAEAPDTAGVGAPHVLGATPLPSPEVFTAAVEAAVARIGAGDLEKVVLARRLDLTFDREVDTTAVLARLRAMEPESTVFAHDVGTARFVGATPELLVARHGDHVVCRPLAGTIALDATASADAGGTLFRSAKDRAEHRFVVRDVAAHLAPYCGSLHTPEEPSAIVFHSIVHLGTRIDGTLRSGPEGPADVLELLAALHPTPAVGGTPRDLALATMDELEGAGRGPWAGPVGWMDAHGDGEWYIGIRSALVEAGHATLWAGVGIVADSEPAAELAETDLKFTVMLDALGATSGERLSA